MAKAQSLAVSERQKYEKVWSIEGYKNFSPGEYVLPLFRQMVRMKPGATLLDIGCGTGRVSQRLSDLGWNVSMMDHVQVNKDSVIPFYKQNLWTRWRVSLKEGDSVKWDQGYCCDVMEHIPPKEVDKTLKNILSHCDRVFFSIHFGEDNFGAAVGHPLHLTVKPFMWWADKLREYGTVVQARDLLGMGVYDVKRV
jgi:SAM-dependent methyltransferase